MPRRTRLELIKSLESCLGKKVFAIVYNPDFEENISQGDEIYFSHFIENVIKKEKIKDCVIILFGPGGHLKTSILCSELLRKNINKYSIFVPSVAGSSLSYFVLQANCLIVGNKSCLTQIDPTFLHKGQTLRAIKCLNHPDPRIKKISSEFFNPVFENLKRVICTWPNVFEKEISKRSQKKVDYLIKVTDYWMHKGDHFSKITPKDLVKLRVNFFKVSDSVTDCAIGLIQECIRELQDEGQRFMIQTGLKEEQYQGGFFYP